MKVHGGRRGARPRGIDEAKRPRGAGSKGAVAQDRAPSLEISTPAAPARAAAPPPSDRLSPVGARLVAAAGPLEKARGLRVGVDLGGTNVRAAVVDVETGRLLAVRKEKHADRSIEAVVDSIARAVRAAAEEAGLDVAAFSHVGVGVPGPVDGASGHVHKAPNLGWTDVPLGALLQQALGVPVRIANDLKVAALGEAGYGAARGKDNVLLFYVGTGVGSAALFRGELVEGARGVAGEVGHTKVVLPGGGRTPLPCGCGQAGCLEAYAGGANLTRRAREQLEAGVDEAEHGRSLVRDLVGLDLSQVTPSLLDEAYRKGDAWVRALWEDDVGPLLGAALANTATLLNPEAVVLGGGVLQGCPGLVSVVERNFRALAPATIADVPLARPALGDDSGMLGAARLPPPQGEGPRIG